MLVSGQAGPRQGPVALGEAFAAASRDPPGPRRQPAPCTASPAAAAPRDRRHNTEGGLDRVDPGADERGAADGRAPAVFARAAAIASQAKPSKWWMLLLIIPAIATGLAVVASQFQKERRQGTLFKNFRRRWTNWQARLAGHFDLMGDNITQWSRRASRPVQIDPTSPSSERPSPRPWYKQRRNTPITPASCSNRPSSSLTTFDPKSLEIRELAEMNEWLIAFGDLLLAAPGRHPSLVN